MLYSEVMSYVAKNLNLTQTWNNGVFLAEQIHSNIPNNVKEVIQTSDISTPFKIAKLTSDYLINSSPSTPSQQTFALSVAGIATLGIIAYSTYNYCKGQSPTKQEVTITSEESDLLEKFNQLIKTLDNIYDPDIDNRLNKADKIKNLCEEAFEIHRKDTNNSIDFKNKVEEIRTLVNNIISNREPEAQEKIKKESEELIASVTKCASLQGIAKNKNSFKLPSPTIEILPPSPQGARINKHVIK